jgi:HMG (high mobility group) box
VTVSCEFSIDARRLNHINVISSQRFGFPVMWVRNPHDKTKMNLIRVFHDKEDSMDDSPGDIKRPDDSEDSLEDIGRSIKSCKDRSGHIRRPANAFILYRLENQSKVRAENPGLHNCKICELKITATEYNTYIISVDHRTTVAGGKLFSQGSVPRESDSYTRGSQREVSGISIQAEEVVRGEET